MQNKGGLLEEKEVVLLAIKETRKAGLPPEEGVALIKMLCHQRLGIEIPVGKESRERKEG